MSHHDDKVRLCDQLKELVAATLKAADAANDCGWGGIASHFRSNADEFAAQLLRVEAVIEKTS